MVDTSDIAAKKIALVGHGEGETFDPWARDSLDGATDLDQGIAVSGGASNIVPADANGIAFSRSAGQVLNIVFLNRTATNRGGFFPNGVNGTIALSAASG